MKKLLTAAAGTLVLVSVLALASGPLGRAASLADTTKPVVASHADVTANATGASTAVTYTAPTATDETDPPNPAVSCSPASGSGFPLGSTLVTCSATDTAGNTGTSTFHVIVSDVTPPTLSSHADVTANATGASTVVTYTAPSASDAVDPSPSVSCSPASGSGFAVGSTLVTCTATDASGNHSSTTFNVIVQGDVTPPTLAPHADVTANATGASTVVTYTAPAASDAVDPSPSVSCSPASGSGFAVGSTLVTCTATDASGNHASSTFHVVVADTTPPALSSHADVTASQTGATTVVSYTAPAASDAVDPSPSVSCSPASGSGFAAGSTLVTCTATDASGNHASSTFHVVVADTTPPTIALDAPAGGAKLTGTVSLAVSGVSDGNGVAGVSFRFCDATANATCTPASGSSAAGTDGGGGSWTATPAASAFVDGHSYTWDAVATDAAGNAGTTGTRSFVVDRTVPVLVVPSAVRVEADGGGGSRVSYTVSGSDDGEALAAAAITCKPASGSLFSLGTTQVSCSTAPDPGGNVGSASFSVSVVDTTSPILAVPPDSTVTATSAAGIPKTASAVARLLAAASAVDLVDGRRGVSNNAPGTLPVGTTVVVFTAKDGSGNAATKSMRITVSVPPARGGGGGGATPATPKAIDTTPPANPPALVAVPGPGWIRLTWKLPADKDLDHVEIFRSGQRTSAALSESRVYSGTGTSFTDRGLRATMRYRYLVVAFDKTGNRSTGSVAVSSPKLVMLTAPAAGIAVKRVPVLRWRPRAGARYYNVQLYRGKTKILSAWPKKVTLKLAASWRYRGKRFRLTPGTYHWYVWPGTGARAAGTYGAVLGESTFVVPKGIKLKSAAAAKKKPKKAKTARGTAQSGGSRQKVLPI